MYASNGKLIRQGVSLAADANQATIMCLLTPDMQIISGGEEGMVRVWRIGRTSQTLEASMKDHKVRLEQNRPDIVMRHRAVALAYQGGVFQEGGGNWKATGSDACHR
jgi:hypothetical protein